MLFTTTSAALEQVDSVCAERFQVKTRKMKKSKVLVG
jgi:hypothetical protein